MGIIEFNGISSKDLGVEVETFPDYVAPEKEYQVTHVPGRNGDLVVDTKTFQNVPRSYEVSVATNGVPIEVVNAAVARFKSSSRMPIKSLTSQIVAVQAGSGVPSPDNEREIIGFDNAVIQRCGKNLFNASTLRAGDYNLTNPTIRVSQNLSDRIKCFAGITYTFSFITGNDYGVAIVVTNENNVIIETINLRAYNNITFTPTMSGYLTIVFLNGTGTPWSSLTPTDCQNLNPMVEISDTATTYEAYNGNTYTFTFGQTVYGGHFDNKGSKPITHKSVDLGSLTWRYISSYKLFIATLSPNPLGDGDCFSSIYEKIPANRLANDQTLNYKMALGWIISANCINIRNTDYTDADEFKTAMSGVYLFYELATPRPTSNGNLVITHGIIDLSAINFVYYQSGANFAYVLMPTYKRASILLCSQYSQIPRSKIGYSEPYDDTVKGVGMDGQYLFIKDVDRITTAGQQALLRGVQLVYELANPIVLPITSQNIFTLPGENTIFSNSGDVSVKVEPSFSTIINQVAEWLHSASGYARLEDTYDSDHYRMAYYSESLSVENLFNEAGKATLNFICKPQRYLKSGETPVVFTEEGTIQNGTRFSSSPVLKVTTDNTQGSVSIGNHTITIKAGAGTDPITIDCELQDAWSGTTNKNSFIVLTDGEFPVIDPGTQTVTFDGGVQSVEVIPRWWTV